MVKHYLLVMVLFLSVVFVGQGLLTADENDIAARLQKMEDEITSLKRELANEKVKSKETFVKDDDIDEEREKKIDEMLSEYEKIQGESSEQAKDESRDSYFSKKTQELEDNNLARWFGGTDTKPFLEKMGRNTYVGGYMDMEFRAVKASADTLSDTPNTPASDRGGQSTFRQFRFVPFIYSDVSDRIKLSAELEFEFEGVGGGRAGEVIVEFATIDFLIQDWINFRAGVILAPVGKLNLVHDTPLQDMVDRPMVSQMIIPSTLSDTGMGFFGSFYAGAVSKFDYEIYMVNGFQALDDNDGVGGRNISRSAGMAGSNGGYRENQNNSFDTVGRLGYSPFIGLELGASFHTGKYDERNDNRLTIAAFDWMYQKGAFEFAGEIARDYISHDDFAEAAGITDDMWGYYSELRYHFLPLFLKQMAPTFFTDESTFTGVLRHGHVETASQDQFYLRDRVTVGLNYRITEDTVFKLDYQINTEHKDLPSANNNEVLFQVATYF